MGAYDDIIDLPHHVSKKHPQMSMQDRAAQFSPFAALTGHNEAIKETQRLTQQRIELDEYEKGRINAKLQMIQNKIEQHPQITVTYFEPDYKKDGGEYRTVTDSVKKIDENQHKMILENEEEIKLENILSIKGYWMDLELRED